MTQEEQNIKHKIENLSDTDLYFDDTNLWQRLEEHLDEKKPQKQKLLWLWWAAASLLIGGFFLMDFERNEVTQVIILPKEEAEVVTKIGKKRAISTVFDLTPNPSPKERGVKSPPFWGGLGGVLSENTTFDSTFETPTRLAPKERGAFQGVESPPLGGGAISAKFRIRSYNDTKTNFFVKNTDSQAVMKDILDERNIFSLEKITPKYKIDSFLVNKKTIIDEPKFKIERVTVVDFPLIPDQLMKRENFAKRAFRQIKSFNTEGKIDWRELNIEPRNVWAYLGQNFKYDTTTISNKKTKL